MTKRLAIRLQTLLANEHVQVSKRIPPISNFPPHQGYQSIAQYLSVSASKPSVTRLRVKRILADDVFLHRNLRLTWRTPPLSMVDSITRDMSSGRLITCCACVLTRLLCMCVACTSFVRRLAKNTDGVVTLMQS